MRRLLPALALLEPGWLGFASHRLGYALVSSKLWRTGDGGSSWQAVPIR